MATEGGGGGGGAGAGGSSAGGAGPTVLFDGANFDNWEYDARYWSISDNAMSGTGCFCMAFTKKDYAKYRLFVTGRIKSPVDDGASFDKGQNQLGILVWGPRHAGDFNPKGTVSCAQISSDSRIGRPQHIHDDTRVKT